MKKFRRLWAVAAVLLGIGLLPLAPAQAAQQLFSGQIGTLAVVAVRDTVSQDWRYFYARHRQSIELYAESSDCAPAWTLCLSENNREGRTLRWMLNPDPKTGGWRGWWQSSGDPAAKSPAAVRWPISLRPMAAPKLPAGLSAQDQGFLQQRPYLAALTGGKPFVPVRQQSWMGKGLQWYRSPVNGSEHFLLTSGYPAPTLQRLNRLLRDSAWAQVEAWSDCLGSASGLGEYDTTVTPRLMTSTLFSMSRFSSYYCGGAHPDFGDDPLNYSIAHDRELTLEEVLWVGRGPARRFEGKTPQDSLEGAVWDAYSQYRSSQLAPWLYRQLTRLYPQDMQGGKEGGAGALYSVGDFDFPVWYLTPQGLYVSPTVARAVRATEYPEFTLLPWALVRQHPGALPLALPR